MRRLKPKSYNLIPSLGFTLTELIVAVAIFAFTVTAMMVLLNYTLRINRRTEAVRQTAQSIRNFVEFITKEMRNGRIDYSTNSIDASVAPITPCPQPRLIAGSPQLFSDTYGPGASITDTAYPASFTGYRNAYLLDNSDTHLGLVNAAGERQCFFWGNVNETGLMRFDQNGTDYTDSPTCSYGTVSGNVCTDGNFNNGENLDSILMTKEGVTGNGSLQIINPPNVNVSFVRFFIRPAHDPYLEHQVGGNDRPQKQPLLTMLMRFTVRLPTGETVVVPYQTTISSDDYGIPK